MEKYRYLYFRLLKMLSQLVAEENKREKEENQCYWQGELVYESRRHPNYNTHVNEDGGARPNALDNFLTKKTDQFIQLAV